MACNVFRTECCSLRCISTTTTPSSPVDDCPRGMMAHLCVYIGLGIVVSVVVVLIVFLLLRRGQQTLARKPAWAFVAAVPILLFFAGMAAAVFGTVRQTVFLA